MTPDQVHLIRSSFDALWPIRGELAEVFYRRFFELAPDARRLFPDDMERQKAKLMDAIATIVGALDQHEVLQSIIIDTGRQHRQIGVQPSHFVAFGEALMGGLDRYLGPAFTPELKQAWLVLYDTVQSQMIHAARSQM
jgi:hemoglobin-like flavoprotein